jgi:hypothetical protein
VLVRFTPRVFPFDHCCVHGYESMNKLEFKTQERKRKRERKRREGMSDE